MRTEDGDKQPASAQHEDIADLRMVDLVLGHTPDLGLGEERDGARGTAVVGQERATGDDEQTGVLARLAPVERIVRVVAGLGDENRLAVGSELEVGGGMVAALAEGLHVEYVAFLLA